MKTIATDGVRGRFAPSPTGELHLGNLRTAVVADELARSNGGTFVVRMEDLDGATASKTLAHRQIADLADLGVASDLPIVFQSSRFELYESFVRELESMGLVYQCFCSRKDVAEAAVAPHGGFPIYGGRCRELSTSQVAQLATERRPALRLRVDSDTRSEGLVNDIVLVRNDGVPAYNLAVVVDDELQGITQVVRGADLEAVTPSQRHLQRLLRFRELDYVHLPLVVGPDGQRLAKRHGDASLDDCRRLGFSADEVRRALLRSLEVDSHGWGQSSNLAEWLKSLL